MSDINLDFTVSNNNIDFTVQPNDITFTPTDIQLTFSTGGSLTAGGANSTVQYNVDGILNGSTAFTFDPVANIANIRNINSIGNATIANINVTQKANLGIVSNVIITGGTNGYVLQTDGTGNLDWTAMTGGGGNGAPGGSNTQIQYNDNGLFGGNSGFTFNEVSGIVNMPNNLTVNGNITSNYYIGNGSSLSSITGANVTGNVANATFATTAGNAIIAGTVYTNAQPNITSLGTLTSLSVSGNISTTGTTTIQQAKEKVTTNVSGASSTIYFDVLTQAILYYTGSATSNFILNIRGNSTVALNTVMSNNESLTCAFINRNGFPAYIANTIQIDGSNITVNWNGGTAPSAGTTNAFDIYNFNIIKTGTNAYSVFGSSGGYY